MSSIFKRLSLKSGFKYANSYENKYQNKTQKRVPIKKTTSIIDGELLDNFFLYSYSPNFIKLVYNDNSQH